MEEFAHVCLCAFVWFQIIVEQFEAVSESVQSSFQVKFL